MPSDPQPNTEFRFGEKWQKSTPKPSPAIAMTKCRFDSNPMHPVQRLQTTKRGRCRQTGVVRYGGAHELFPGVADDQTRRMSSGRSLWFVVRFDCPCR